MNVKAVVVNPAAFQNVPSQNRSWIFRLPFAQLFNDIQYCFHCHIGCFFAVYRIFVAITNPMWPVWFLPWSSSARGKQCRQQRYARGDDVRVCVCVKWMLNSFLITVLWFPSMIQFPLFGICYFEGVHQQDDLRLFSLQTGWGLPSFTWIVRVNPDQGFRTKPLPLCKGSCDRDRVRRVGNRFHVQVHKGSVDHSIRLQGRFGKLRIRQTGSLPFGPLDRETKK